MSVNREEILDAAETIFADRGYAAAALREIARAAGVTQAMVNYYFGSKQNLFTEVYLRRGRHLARDRLALLDGLTSASAFTVEDVLRAYLIPPFRLRATAPGRSFLRLQTRLHCQTDPLAFELRRSAYDNPVKAYVEVLRTLMPDIPEGTLYLRFTQLVGVYLYILSDLHRIEEISGNDGMVPPDEQMIEEIVAFAAAGFRHRARPISLSTDSSEMDSSD